MREYDAACTLPARSMTSATAEEEEMNFMTKKDERKKRRKALGVGGLNSSRESSPILYGATSRAESLSGHGEDRSWLGKSSSVACGELDGGLWGMSC